MSRILRITCIALFFVSLLGSRIAFGEGQEIKAVYFGSNAYGSARTDDVVRLLTTTEVNAVVLDYKDDHGKVFSGEQFKRIAKPFRDAGAFIICRIVTLKDAQYVETHPELALKSRRTKRTWTGDKNGAYLDPAMLGTQDYIVSIAERAIDDGCQELNFDYIRFPDGPNLSDILLPVSNDSKTKWPYLRRALREFSCALALGIRKKSTTIPYSADLFGYAAMGGEPGIGQFVEDFAECGYGLYGMFYPSHYRCKAFGVHDPNTDPFRVYFESMKAQLQRLKKYGHTSVAIRPWLQGFSIANIYKCGGKVEYADDPARFGQQIRALDTVRGMPEFKGMGIDGGWIVWNPGAYYNPNVFSRKKKPKGFIPLETY